MKKILKNLIVHFDLKLNKIYLLILENNNLQTANLICEDIVGNIFCESIFKKNLITVFKNIQLDKNYNYSLKVILPDEFFNIKTMSVNNNIKNNFFTKKAILEKLNANKNFIFNYKKININKNNIVFDTVYINKWLFKAVFNFAKIKKIRTNAILSENLAQINFIKNNSSFNNNNFILLSENNNNLIIKFIQESICKKSLIFNLNLKNYEESSFNSLCKSLSLTNFYKRKQSVFNNINNGLNVQNIVKAINNINKNNNYKIVVVSDDSNKFTQQIINLDKTNKYINLSEMVNKINCLNNLELIGSLNNLDYNNLYCFNYELICKIKIKLNNFIENFRSFVNYFKPKKQQKFKNIKIKEE